MKAKQYEIFKKPRPCGDLSIFAKTHFPHGSNWELNKTQDSHTGRYPDHDLFLARRRRSISTFADIGPALGIGAPTTLDAKKALPNARVIAVDVVPAPHSLSPDIDVVMHNITKGPLEMPVDAIRFSFVAQHLSRKERDQAIKNIHRSLNNGGLLLNEDSVFRKNGKSFEHIGDFHGDSI